MSNLYKLKRLIESTLAVTASIGHLRNEFVKEFEQFLGLRIAHAIIIDRLPNDRAGWRTTRTILASVCSEMHRDHIASFNVICDHRNNVEGSPISVNMFVKFTSGVVMDIHSPGFSSRHEWADAWNRWSMKNGGSQAPTLASRQPADIMAITRKMIGG